MVELTRERIDPAELMRRIKTVDAGAVAVFCGDVRRDGPEENPLVALDYSAHEEMALEQMRRIRERAMAEFAVCDVALAHRLGRLSLGETSVVVAVAAAHRDAAFEACRFVIDTVKKDVPIWKKEIRADGESAWVDPSREP